MILDDVARHPRLLVELAAAFDTNVLGDRNLDMVDVLPAPYRLEERVGEAEHEEVLDGFLPEVMVDPEDLGLVERRCDGVVVRPRALQVMPEGLLEDDPRPGSAHGIGRLSRPFHRRGDELRRAQALDDVAELVRGHGEIKEAVAPGPPLGVHTLERGLEGRVGARVVRGATHVRNAPLEIAPQGRVDGLASGELHHGVPQFLAEGLVRFLTTRHADDGKASREGAAPGQVVERGHELAAREVAGGSEDDDRASVARPILCETVSQRIGSHWSHRSGRLSHAREHSETQHVARQPRVWRGPCAASRNV